MRQAEVFAGHLQHPGPQFHRVYLAVRQQVQQRTGHHAAAEAKNRGVCGLCKGNWQQHGAAVLMNGKMGPAAIYLALLKHRIKGHHPMFAIVDHQNATECVPGVMDNLALHGGVPCLIAASLFWAFIRRFSSRTSGPEAASL